ncbi:MAG: hypothetical protein LBR23_09090 [Spirochaetaceae bacterium]|jgi:hypothetical protein|nr:hypothetical protein [Spirochaetaceae bacterium]
MAEEQKRPKAVYEPGELARTRKNLGEIDPEEAMLIANRLGGVVGVEKAAPANPSLMKRMRPRLRVIQRNQPPKAGQAGGGPKAPPKAASAVREGPAGTKGYSLPSIPPQEERKMDLLMMSEDYQIKRDYGAFNFLVARLFKKRTGRVLDSFAQRTLLTHINRLQGFSAAVFSIVQAAPDAYKENLDRPEELKFKFLKKLALWPKLIDEIRTHYGAVEQAGGPVTVEMLIPVVRSIYRMVLQVYYLRSSRIAGLFRTIFFDLGEYPEVKKKELAALMRNAVSGWQYINANVVQGLCPLLMRMCSAQYMDPDTFFTAGAQRILPFLGITKYDLLLPGKQQENRAGLEAQAGERKNDEAARERELAVLRRNARIRQERQQQADRGFKLLDMLFPGAGWLSLTTGTDMYPYFQPLYQFPDGFNLVAPENPVQVTVVLLRIIEDLFYGCRGIRFSLPEGAPQDSEDLSQAMFDWMGYREILFEKNYSQDLKNYVNNLNSKTEFQHSALGKKLYFTLLWETKFYFLPFFKIDMPSMEKLARDAGKLPPLGKSAGDLRRTFAFLTEKIDGAFAARTPIEEIPNVWDKYRFDLENVVSHRLNALLGAKKNSPMAVNGNLIKYTAGVLAALDWWLNDEDSPAQDQEKFKLFRSAGGEPVFTAPLMNNQNELFKNNLRALAMQSARHAAEAPAEPPPQAEPPRSTPEEPPEPAQGAALGDGAVM